MLHRNLNVHNREKIESQGGRVIPKNMKRVKNVGTSNMDGLKRKQQRRKNKKKTQNFPQDEVSPAKRRIKYIFLKMKVEQNLIDEYSREG